MVHTVSVFRVVCKQVINPFINKNKEYVVGNGFSWMGLIGPVSKDNKYLLSFLSVGLNDAYAFIKPCLRLFLLPDWFAILYECQVLN